MALFVAVVLIAALIALDVKLTSAAREQGATLLALGAILLALAGEGIGVYKRIVWYEPVKATLLKMQECGARQAACYRQQGSYAARAPLDAGDRDAWGHTFVYERLSPGSAAIIAPGADGKITWSTSEVNKDEDVAIGDVDHDLVVKLDGEQLALVVFPHGLPSCGPCRVPSVARCLRYFGEEVQ